MAIIEVNNVTKEYRLGHMKSLKQTALNTIDRLRGRPAPKQEPFKALDDVDFKVEEGEVLGIIGTNGAGKSTLLKLLARVSVPTKGDINVRGSVAPLIEVGAGLHPELTGRENIFLNGSIMGLPRAVIKEKFDEIVEFAELEEFIDTPIKRYSSGMMIRLGFSIATSVDADILIIDEVLAVGDLAFQRKCFDRMENLIKGQGKTVLLVSHNIRQVERMCSRVMLFDKGKILMNGEPAKVCNIYYNMTNKKVQEHHIQSGSKISPQNSSGEIDVEDILLFRDDGTESMGEVELHEPMRIGVKFQAHVDLPSPEVVIGFHTSDFVYIVSTSSAMIPDRPDFAKGPHYFECKLHDMALRPGFYNIRLAFIDQCRRIMWYGENLKTFKVTSNKVDVTKMPEVGLVDLPFSWDYELRYINFQTMKK